MPVLPFLFVHIPKTAGTSFRVGLQRIAAGRILRDYGSETPETTDALRPIGYPLQTEAVRALVDEQEIEWIVGHVPYRRYAFLVPPERVVAFVRDPVERVVSEYHHFRRHHGYVGTLAEFALDPRNHDMQARCLRGLPLERIALLGVSSQYDRSLALFERRTGIRVESIQTNQNPDHCAPSQAYDISDDDRALIEAHNPGDRAIVASATAALDDEGAANDAPTPPKREDLIGWVDRLDGNQIVGWVAYRGGAAGEPLRVEAYAGDRLLGQAIASLPRPDLVQKGLHATGHAGFRIPVERIHAGTTIRCVAQPGDFELSGRPIATPR
jgi:hypothetical protein